MPETRFEVIMQHLNPKALIAKIEIPHDTIRASYPLKCSVVRSNREFQEALIHFMQYYWQARFNTSAPPDVCLGDALNYIKGAFGSEDNAAYIALSGTEGGLPAVLNAISEGWKRKDTDNYIDYILDKYCDPLNFDEVCDLLGDFKKALKGFAPYSFDYVSPAELFKNHRRIMKDYILSLRKYKNLWAY
ncbi:MAG: hypothetical protein A4E71_00555 [Smithella sp. PtaU1.Bin162]|nr:MAG: hypothetical protein A4E71_00555 [Smithella sp. PtaU1.Bin162]